MKTYSYKDLVVWQLSFDLAKSIMSNKKLNHCQSEAIQMPILIAQGNQQKDKTEFPKYLAKALDKTIAVIISLELTDPLDKEIELINESACIIQKMLNALIYTLNHTKKSDTI